MSLMWTLTLTKDGSQSQMMAGVSPPAYTLARGSQHSRRWVRSCAILCACVCACVLVSDGGGFPLTSTLAWVGWRLRQGVRLSSVLWVLALLQASRTPGDPV